MTRLFSHRGEECTHRVVRNKPATLLITALLMFQLAFGVHRQLANAATVLPVQGMSALDGEHCPAHHPQPSEADQRLGAQARSHVPSFPTHRSISMTAVGRWGVSATVHKVRR